LSGGCLYTAFIGGRLGGGSPAGGGFSGSGSPGRGGGGSLMGVFFGRFGGSLRGRGGRFDDGTVSKAPVAHSTGCR